MGSYAAHQARVARARAALLRRKECDLPSKVTLVPLRQEKLYTFQAPPATGDRIDHILSKLVRKEQAMLVAEKELREHQDSKAVISFFHALNGVRKLEKKARNDLIVELKETSDKLKEARNVAIDKKNHTNFFVDRIAVAEKRMEEMKELYAERSSVNETISDQALDISALAAAEQRLIQRHLDATAKRLWKEMREHEESRRLLSEMTEDRDIIHSKLTELMELYAQTVASNEMEIEVYLNAMASRSSELQRVEQRLGLANSRLTLVRRLADRMKMASEDEYARKVREAEMLENTSTAKVKGQKGSTSAGPAKKKSRGPKKKGKKAAKGKKGGKQRKKKKKK